MQHALLSPRNVSPNKMQGRRAASAVNTEAAAAAPTALAYFCYGSTYVDHALAYHVTRLDHRHNLAAFWLPIYAVEGLPGGSRSKPLLRRALAVGPFLAHGALQAAAVVGLRRDLAATVFAQTLLFVAANKVCTAQYFCWWLPFAVVVAGPGLVHARHGAAKRRSVARALGYWAAALAAWLAVAFRLEFAGDAAHGPLWALGLGFLAANAGLLAAVLDAGGVS